MDDLAFRIQLGLILPKMKAQMASDLNKIVAELVDILQAGTREGEELEIGPIKEIVMKDLEIFLDDHILPDIEAKINPPAEEEPEEAEAEPEAEEEAAE